VRLSDGESDPLLAAEARIAAVLQHPSTSYWLRDALGRALDRDPVDAVDDAEALHELLVERTTAVFERVSDRPISPRDLRR